MIQARHVSSPHQSEAQFISPAPSPHGGEVRYVARQPILDTKQHLYGYELLFRAGANDALFSADTVIATHSTLELALLVGPQSFTDGHRAFINCTREALCAGIVSTLPKELCVAEILEDVPDDAEVVRECRRLKMAGYRIALDDIVSDTDRPALLELADIIKVDFLNCDASQQKAIAKRFARHGVLMLAEKVETHEQFHDAVRMGYTLFQGYFFCRPETIEARDLPSLHAGYLNVLSKVYESELDIPAMERAIREEPSLCYRLLRYLNSAAFGVAPVRSIVEVLNLLGRDGVRKWVSLVTTISLAGPRSAELLRMALTRARFCELLAEHLGVPSTDFFLVGLFSLLDAILDRPMEQIIGQIPISVSCREALTGVLNPQGIALQLSIASGRGQWDSIGQLCTASGCTELDAWRCQLGGQEWVRAVLNDPIVTNPVRYEESVRSVFS